MITVACVLRTGGTYTAEWVNRLYAGVQRHLSVAHDFVCVTNDAGGIDSGVCIEEMRHDWPGWWAKMNLWGIPWNGLVMYFDLDTVITGGLSDFAAYAGPRAILRDLLRPTIRIGSGMVLWRDDAMRHIWEAFTEDPVGNMATYNLRSDFFTQRHLEPVHFIQDLWPGQVVSSKREARNGVPLNARVVCMHGRPRMTDLPRHHHLRRIWEAA